MTGDEESRLRVTGRWEETHRALPVQLESTEAPKGKAEIFKRIAEVFHDRLNDPEQAIDALVEAVLARSVDNDIVDALESSSASTPSGLRSSSPSTTR